jgi:sialate O-acetylesterase
MKSPLSVLYIGAAFALALIFCATPCLARVQLHPLFTNDTVLQRERPLLVWGTAAPREKVTVRVAGDTGSTQADDDGNWRVELPALPATNSTTLEARGENIITLQNVAIGDVYLCAGQSNMEWPVSQSDNAEKEIAAADYPAIRYFAVPKRVAGTPQNNFPIPTRWQVCNPQNVADFSAVAYFFARDVNRETKVPIGLIEASWGGVIAQAFLSQNALSERDDLREQTQQTMEKFAPAALEKLDEKLRAWWNANDEGSRENRQAPDFDDGDWKTVSIPTQNESEKLPLFSGAMWLRRALTIPEAWKNRDLVLHLGAIKNADTTFFNGQKIGATAMWNQQRTYVVPREMVQSGRATIAVRMMSLDDSGGFMDRAAPRLEVVGEPSQNRELSDHWKYRAGNTALDFSTMPTDVRVVPDQPGVLFNAMIAPIVPLSMRGVLWWQGESNIAAAAQYRTLFPDLIRDWRKQWNRDLPFYFVQLSTFGAPSEEAVQSGWAELREAQTLALQLPKTAMAVSLDVGNGGYHPTNKQEVGRRLALAALAKEYGQAREYSGPVFRKMKIENGAARLDFSHAAGLKTSDENAPRGFAICGADEKWFSAQARIEGEAIFVSHELVSQPVVVRYAWKDCPAVNLVNAAGLPAAPFRTDAPKDKDLTS